MIQGLFMRLLALCIWLPSVYLTYFLIREFTDGQSMVIIGIAMVALLVSSVSLLTGRGMLRRGDKVAASASFAMYALSVAVVLFFELGFWNSSVSTGHALLTRANAAREGVDMLAERDRRALRAGQIAETPAEIVAKMDAQLASPIGGKTLGMLTSNCADKTTAAFRLCQDYLNLKASLAKAEATEKVEQRIWSAGTSVETGALKRDLFAGATAVASAVGGSAEGWAIFFSAMMVLMLMATRDLSLLIAFAPFAPRQSREEARAAPEAAPAPVAAPEPALPTVEAVSAAMKPKSPPPTNGGTRQVKPEPKPAPAPVDENKVVRIAERTERLPASAFFEEAAPPRKLRRGDRRHHPVGAAKAWLRDCTERTPDLAMTVSTQDAWDHYREWCEAADLRILPRSRFERAVSAKVGSTSIRGQRCYIGLVLVEAEENRARAVA